VPTTGIMVELQAARLPGTTGSNWIRVQLVDKSRNVVAVWHINVV
jgi:hypothetical protein